MLFNNRFFLTPPRVRVIHLLSWLVFILFYPLFESLWLNEWVFWQYVCSSQAALLGNNAEEEVIAPPAPLPSACAFQALLLVPCTPLLTYTRVACLPAQRSPCTGCSITCMHAQRNSIGKKKVAKYKLDNRDREILRVPFTSLFFFLFFLLLNLTQSKMIFVCVCEKRAGLFIFIWSFYRVILVFRFNPLPIHIWQIDYLYLFIYKNKKKKVRIFHSLK